MFIEIKTKTYSFYRTKINNLKFLRCEYNFFMKTKIRLHSKCLYLS